MAQPKHSIDGFVPRRAPSGQHRSLQADVQSRRTISTAPQKPDARHIEAPRRAIGAAPAIAKSDLDESLKSIDQPDGKKVKQRRGQKSKTRRIIKWTLILLGVAILVVGGYLAYKAFNAGGQIFKGSLLDIVQNQPLKEDANGRSNILIFGTSEDDPGHEGADLTDSIMVVSLSQKEKNAYMISIPRDLYVKYGAACPEGYQGKINSMYMCFAGDGDEAKGAEALKGKVGEVLGLDIQYYTHLNYTAVRQAVDAVGGIEVTVESNDPRGILDRNFDWKCNYQCYYVNYKNGQTVQMDGEHALAFARARNAAGGYGLPNGNFDREKNQQKVIVALREKAVGVGTLTDLGKVTGLLDALGNNLRTNFEVKEIRTLMALGNDIKGDSIQSISLVEEGEMVLKTANVGGASIVQPIAGLYSYNDIQKYVLKKLTANEVTREGASVVVLNGSGVVGVAQREADNLEAKGFVIGGVDNAPSGTYEAVEVYQIGEGMSATKAKLEEVYGVSVKTTPPPVSVAAGVNFVVVIGQEQAANSTN